MSAAVRFTVSTDEPVDRYDPGFRKVLTERISKHRRSVAVEDIGGGAGEGVADFDFEAIGERGDIDALLRDLQNYYPKVREWGA